MLPFFRSQKLYVLKPGVDSRAALHPEQFHAGRRQQGEGQGEEPVQPDTASWAELPRADLLAGASNGQPFHRVALTTDAGLGKTYNLAWLCHELNDRNRRLRAFILPIGKLDSPVHLIERFLVPEVQSVPGNEAEDPQRLQAALERLRHRGRLVLLFDGLDMAGDDSVDALARLLEPRGEWSRCRIVVAGRPFALERHWDKLFEGRSWQFVQIAEFDARQQRAALGKIAGRDRYDLIPREARNLLTSPRVLEYLQPLGADQLERLKTVADVYWQACGYMLRQALGRRMNVFTQERFLGLLAALAFTMYARTERHAETGALRPNLERIVALDMKEFLDEVRQRLKAAVPDFSRKEFLKYLRKLSRLNALLNHGWLDVKTVGGVGEDLLWRSASLQEFFAAYWVARWGDEADTSRLRDWVVDPLTDSNRGFYWFWRYGSEMPDEAIGPNSKDPPASWQDAMTPLYDGSVKDANGNSIRSTEFIYRCWKRMERWNAGSLQKFLKEFPDLRAGKAGAGKKQLAEKMLAGFILLAGSGQPDDTGTFTMGAPADEDPAWDIRGSKQNNPQHNVSLSPYGLHRFCVTNLDYELFDPRHRAHRWWPGHQHPSVEETGDLMADNSCPVVMVSWYDAWCFARWIGAVRLGKTDYRIALPTEAQWEYACRAGRDTPFTFHEGHDGLTCTAEVCNFHGNYPFGKGAQKGKNRGRTLTVNALEWDPNKLKWDSVAFKPNRWGFYQLNGNVWEWCEDWYSGVFFETARAKEKDSVNEEGASEHVLRGGSWILFGGSCRSAVRGRGEPDYRLQDCGFRLAAVPCVVGAK
jgi:formylglycine-generating enzyme required for sulfatase activity